MTVKVILQVRAKPNTGNVVAEFLQSIMPEARAYAGCTSAVAYQSREDADDVLLMETWDSREHYERYIEWRRGEGVSARLKDMLDGEPVTSFVDAGDA